MAEEFWVLIVATAYHTWCGVIRWYLVAGPLRANLLSDLSAITNLRHRGGNSPPRDPPLGDDPELQQVRRQLRPRNGWRRVRSHLLGMIFWPGNDEVRALYLLAGLQYEVPSYLDDDEVDAALLSTSGKLAVYTSRSCQDLRTRITAVLVAIGHLPAPLHAQPPGPHAIPIGERRALLGEALSATYTPPTRFADLAWNRKTELVLLTGLGAAVALAFTADHVGNVLLYGAVGGLLQRLWQLVYQRGTAQSNLNPAYWSTLFLSPVAGALAAVGGLHLISLLVQAGSLTGTLASLGWFDALQGPHTTENLAVAFLLGFSASLLGKLVNRSEAVAAPTS